MEAMCTSFEATPALSQHTMSMKIICLFLDNNNSHQFLSGRKLVVLDLNGSLLLRAKGNRHVWARPYFQSFLGYLFHPTVSNPDHGSKAGLEVMIWSSAQPHSVNFMVDSIFASRKSDLLAIWDRSHFGLTKLQYGESTSLCWQMSQA